MSDLTQLSTACGVLENAFEFDSLSVNATSYGFCALLPAVNVPHCTSCLQVLSTEFYLTNCMSISPACNNMLANSSTQQLS